MIKTAQSWLENSLFASADGPSRRPQLSAKFESNIPGLFVVGDLAGAPVIKLAMEQGYNVIEHIASLPQPTAPEGVSEDDFLVDILVIGAGAAGLNAALAARDRGLSCILLEKAKVANTIENFPEGKWVYAEPDSTVPKGKLWLDGARKEDLIERWHQIVDDNEIDVRVEEPLTAVDKVDGLFTATTPKQSYRARWIVLATGQRGYPRKLDVEGEDQEHVYHRLYSPRHYKDEDILVIGGGNSAIEAALTLCEQNRVVLSYRSAEFSRLFKDNREALDRAVAVGDIRVLFNSNVKSFGTDQATLAVAAQGEDPREEEVPMQHAFVLVGSEVPVRFLKSLGIKLENEWSGSLARSLWLSLASLAGLWLFGGQTGWTALEHQFIPPVGLVLALVSIGSLIHFGRSGDRWAWLGISFLVWYAIYGIKVGTGEEFWPFKNWGYQAMSFFERPWSFWYTVIYTGLMTVFGIQAIKRWGLERKDRFQIWRFVSLLGFQWLFFFLVPEFLFQWAVEYQWVGELAQDPAFADQSWRSYGIVYAWPLFFYTFFYNPHHIWVVWGVLLTFVIIPIFVLFNGKRYCSWICGCGGLAETFGDRWRHLAPKGKTAIRWEKMNLGVLVLATLITVVMLVRDVYGLFNDVADWSMAIYRIGVDVWLIGILPVTLYPFLGGKVWCRYWCPLAKLMDLMSNLYVKLGISRYHIESNDKCISCNECSRNCLVGIDVMSFAMKQDVLDNSNSSCIGCGVCVTVCPMDVLSFEAKPKQTTATGAG